MSTYLLMIFALATALLIFSAVRAVVSKSKVMAHRILDASWVTAWFAGLLSMEWNHSVANTLMYIGAIGLLCSGFINIKDAHYK